MFFIFSFFQKKKFLLFFFPVFHSNMFLSLALVSEFNCFLRSRCSMEMWCPDDTERDSWDWVGPPAWERACFNSPEWGGGSSPVKTKPPQIVLLLLLLLLLLLCCCVLCCCCCCCVLCVVCCVMCVVCCVLCVVCVCVVVVVEWLYYSKRIIIVRWADLSDFFFSFIFVCKMCVFVSRPMKIVTFLRKNDYLP